MTVLNTACINIPVKVGEDAWAKCFRRSLKQPGVSVVHVNESFTKGQRRTYRRIMRRRGWRQFGLRMGPNPIFYHPGVWDRLPNAEQIKLHGRGEKYNLFPGFNDRRFATVLPLQMKVTGEIHVFICSHWVPEGGKVTNRFRRKAREKSKNKIAALIRAHHAAGHFVHFSGDTNIFEKFSFGIDNWQWIRSIGIDKMGILVPEGYKIDGCNYDLYTAPTDHRHGVRGRVGYHKK